MRNSLELQLRKVALLLTIAVLLLLVWSGARLLLLSAPESILPAEASLRVDRPSFQLAEEELSQSLVARPLFWRYRQPYRPPEQPKEEGIPVESGATGVLDAVILHGVYTGAKPGIIITYKGERRRLLLGDSIENWEFTLISPDSVVFESGDDSRTLSLEHALPPATTKKRARDKKAPRIRRTKDNLKQAGEKK